MAVSRPTNLEFSLPNGERRNNPTYPGPDSKPQEADRDELFRELRERDRQRWEALDDEQILERQRNRRELDQITRQFERAVKNQARAEKVEKPVEASVEQAESLVLTAIQSTSIAVSTRLDVEPLPENSLEANKPELQCLSLSWKGQVSLEGGRFYRKVPARCRKCQPCLRHQHVCRVADLCHLTEWARVEQHSPMGAKAFAALKERNRTANQRDGTSLSVTSIPMAGGTRVVFTERFMGGDEISQDRADLRARMDALVSAMNPAAKARIDGSHNWKKIKQRAAGKKSKKWTALGPCKDLEREERALDRFAVHPVKRLMASGGRGSKRGPTVYDFSHLSRDVAVRFIRAAGYQASLPADAPSAWSQAA